MLRNAGETYSRIVIGLIEVRLSNAALTVLGLDSRSITMVSHRSRSGVISNAFSSGSHFSCLKFRGAFPIPGFALCNEVGRVKIVGFLGIFGFLCLDLFWYTKSNFFQEVNVKKPPIIYILIPNTQHDPVLRSGLHN